MNDSEKLKFIRNKIGLSQAKFAESLGFKSSNIGNVEAGIQGISKEIASALRKKYNVNINWLFTDKGSPFITGQTESEEDEISTVKVNLKKGQRLIVNYED